MYVDIVISNIFNLNKHFFFFFLFLLLTQVVREKSKISFFAISGSSKIHRTPKHSNTSHGLNFHRKLIFLNAHNNVLYQNL